MSNINVSGMNSQFNHTVAIDNNIPESNTAGGADTIQLVPGRFNAISVPLNIVDGVNSAEMAWDDASNKFVSTPGQPTRISSIIQQINKRCLGSNARSGLVVVKAQATEAETGLVRTYICASGNTVDGTAEDFPVIIDDQIDTDKESRGFVLDMAPAGNPGANDGGNVYLRLNNSELPFA